MIWEKDGYYFKSTDAVVISREEYEARLEYYRRTGHALPFEWSPECRERIEAPR